MGDLAVYRGDTKSYTLTFTDADDVAVNITGYTVFFTVKINKADADGDAVITKTITSHTTPISGITTVSLTSGDTAITVKDYYYDIQTKDGSGNITTVVVGTFRVLQDVTIKTT